MRPNHRLIGQRQTYSQPCGYSGLCQNGCPPQNGAGCRFFTQDLETNHFTGLKKWMILVDPHLLRSFWPKRQNGGFKNREIDQKNKAKGTMAVRNAFEPAPRNGLVDFSDPPENVASERQTHHRALEIPNHRSRDQPGQQSLCSCRQWQKMNLSAPRQQELGWQPPNRGSDVHSDFHDSRFGFLSFPLTSLWLPP